jgi:twitching motility protein PilT
MELNEILQIALRGGASDIHLKAGLPPMFRVDGSLVPLKDGRRLPPEEVARMAFGIMNEFQKEKFKSTNEVDLAYGVPGLGRFRVNVFQQRGTIGAVLRVIPFKILSVKDLLLPPVLEKISLEERGLILVTGTTGSGKSTTLAAMIDHINATETNHIMTVEDPIEFLIRDKRSIVNQREVGVDTVSFSQALKSALRQDPDVILVGEMRDLETIETALTAAETGHLVLSTLHTLDATETINRIISVFPPYQQKQVRLQLASVLKAVISQRLVPRADGKGRVAAVEILKATARVRELIEDKDRTKEIHDAINQGHQTYGMQSFDQSLMGLVKAGIITYEEARRQATNPDDFALRFSGISSTSDSKWDDFESKPGDAAAPPGPGQNRAAPPVPGRPMAGTPAPGRPAVPGAPAQPRQGTGGGGGGGGTSGGAGGNDDFQIERF